MLERDLWINYAFACCAIVLSSGAGAGLAMCRGASYGPPWASAAIVGQVLGLATILIAAGVGVGSLLMASARTFRAVKLCGAAYLVQWRAPAATRTSTARATPEASWGKRRASEFRTYAANPKGIVFVVAVLPQFIVAGKPLVSPIAVVTITMCVF